MNYHNFASRLSAPRLTPTPQPKASKKPARKVARQPIIRRSLAAAATLLAFICLHADTQAKRAIPLVKPPPKLRVNVPTVVITATGLAVFLLRIPQLWRRDFPS